MRDGSCRTKKKSKTTYHLTKHKRHSRVSLTDEITSSKNDGVSLIDEIPKYSHYLCFTVSVKTNRFALKHQNKYSPEQEKMFQKIKSLHQSGLGYRKIAHQLNAEGITTHQGNKWEGKNVYSVIKRHKEREKRLDFINKEYEPEWSKMEVRWKKG